MLGGQQLLVRPLHAAMQLQGAKLHGLLHVLLGQADFMLRPGLVICIVGVKLWISGPH